MTNSIVLMTALLPSIGHKALVDFARNVSDNVYVLINTRSFEPVSGELRLKAMETEFDRYPNVHFVLRSEDDAPQNDNGSPEFWEYWRRSIFEAFPEVEVFDDVVASEPYGLAMANTLNMNFMPFDVNRETIFARGTDIRLNIPAHWNEILPGFRELIPKRRYVMYGAESVGKTTIGQAVTKELIARRIPSKFFPEWARQYLETVGPELTKEKMADIAIGQTALQRMSEGINHLVSIFDTDLLSTIGYNKILLEKEDSAADRGNAENTFDLFLSQKNSNTKYFFLPDDFKMTPDPLRYGGDVREGDDAFWMNVIDVVDVNYERVPSGSVAWKTQWIADKIQQDVEDQFKSIREFVRE
jgi:HTH-type transcriptional repressor of NAD biosynthesis genes